MEPSILPNIAKSDHQAVIMLPIDGGTHSTGHRIIATVRSNDSNSKSQSNASNWWHETKKLTGEVSKPDLVGLAIEITDGSMQRLANNINASLINVSADLDRLTTATTTKQYVDSESVAPPGECVYNYEITAEIVFNKLVRINIRKAPGSNDLPNWYLYDFGSLCAIPWLASSTRRSKKV